MKRVAIGLVLALVVAFLAWNTYERGHLGMFEDSAPLDTSQVRVWTTVHLPTGDGRAHLWSIDETGTQ